MGDRKQTSKTNKPQMGLGVGIAIQITEIRYFPKM